MASKNPMHNCIREGCNKRLKQSSLRRLWRVVRSDWFWPSGWNKRPNEFFLCRGCNSSRTDLQRVDSERTTTRATGPPAAPPRSVRRQPEAASLALPLQRELPESPPASPTRSDMGAAEGPSGPESSPASPTQSDPGGTDGPPGRKRASAAGGEDGRRKRMRPAERRSGKKRSEEERSEEGRSDEEEEEEEDGDDDDDCAFYYEEGEPPVSSLRRAASPPWATMPGTRVAGPSRRMRALRRARRSPGLFPCLHRLRARVAKPTLFAQTWRVAASCLRTASTQPT